MTVSPRRSRHLKGRKSCGCGHGRAKSKAPMPRDRIANTNADLFLLGLFLALCGRDAPALASSLFGDEGDVAQAEGMALDEDGGHNPVYAVLFPWFAQTIAVIVYYVITRYARILPYTAVVFLLGTVIGYANQDVEYNAVAESATIWLGINGNLILLVFLPGLIFHDSYTINVHLFFQAFWQLIIFAFPMVLGGSVLTALVAGYILPYDWSPSLCMTFGAILSGTDPIAVAGLLNSSGAPDRLKMHISGESLLNDGSVVVLYNIFSALFFYELGVPNGEQFSFGEGLVYFIRLVFGGVAIGLAFGLGTTLMLKQLKRRLNDQENVVQVVLTASSAYLSYFTSEVLCLCSGIIATISCGITVSVLAEAFINDHALTLHFWQVTAELLNTLLFVLGGCLWGNILSQHDVVFDGKDWGWLALLFVILILIRFVLVFALYPITKRVGISTNIRETIFTGFAGFRGSVGIALALSLSAQIHNNTEEGSSIRAATDKLFCLVGGISVFTLLINGMASVPLLSALGLGATEKTRRQVIENYKHQMVQNALQAYVRLLSQERWKGIDHSVVKAHVPFLNDVTFDDLMVAVERHKNNTPIHLYAKPRLEHVFPYVNPHQTVDEASIRRNVHSFNRSESIEHIFSPNSPSYEKLVQIERSSQPSPGRIRTGSSWEHVYEVGPGAAETENVDDINEVRLNYIQILRSSYYHQIENGSLEEHDDLTYSLFQGLNFCEDVCAKGQALNDWKATRVASDTRVVLANRIFMMMCRRVKQLWTGKRKWCSQDGLELLDPDMFKVRFLVRQNLAFVRAHRHAQRVFEEQFASNPLSPAEAQVIEESKTQIELSEAELKDIDSVDVSVVKSHLLCLILLNKSIGYVERLSRQRLIPESAASELLENLDDLVENVWVCTESKHEGRLSTSTQVTRLRRLPQPIQIQFGIQQAIEEMFSRPVADPKTPPRSRTDLKCILRANSSGSGDIPDMPLAPSATDNTSIEPCESPVQF